MTDGFYQPLDLAPDGSLFSRELGVVLKPEGTLLKMIDPDTNQAILTPNEVYERAQAEAERAQAEAERADAAEAETARLRVELERLRRQTGQK